MTWERVSWEVAQEIGGITGREGGLTPRTRRISALPEQSFVLVSEHGAKVVQPQSTWSAPLCNRKLKSQSARQIIQAVPDMSFVIGHDDEGNPIHQVWQESFRAIPLWSTWMIWQKINYIHTNPLKARLVKSVGDYRWSSCNSFYRKGASPLEVDRDWWWPDDVRKLSVAASEWVKEIATAGRRNKG